MWISTQGNLPQRIAELERRIKALEELYERERAESTTRSRNRRSNRLSPDGDDRTTHEGAGVLPSLSVRE